MATKFKLGVVVATPAALEAIDEAQEELLGFLIRHATGDWGELCAEDVAANEEALVTGARLLSSYPLKTGQKLWIITEADRSATTLLLPGDY